MAKQVDEALKKALHEDGAVMVRNLLDEEEIAKLLKCYEWSMAHPGPMAVRPGEGTKDEHYIDNANPENIGMYHEVVAQLGIGDFLAEAWGSEHVWFMSEEIYFKEGEVGRTFWHQDTSYEPWGGQHWATLWITFDALPLGNGLEIVRGSHRGERYDGTAAFNPDDDPTLPFWGDRVNPPMTRMPDIEAERVKDPAAREFLTWDHKVGDVLILHPASLHGGAPVDERTPVRRSLLLRFYGDDACYRGFPEATGPGLFAEDKYDAIGMLFRKHLKEGDLWRDPKALQLR
jgi:hypothetical protein